MMQSPEPETRLQRALRLLAESRAQLEQNKADLTTLAELGHCIRAATASNWELREKVAQGLRDVIWAQDRIRFGRDEAGLELAIVIEAAHMMTGEQTRAGGTPAGAVNRKADPNAETKNRRSQAA